MAEEQYNPKKSSKEYDTLIPDTLSPFRSPAPFQQIYPSESTGGGYCLDPVDGQDGAQTECSGNCHAFFA
jgi:hypothetical protein